MPICQPDHFGGVQRLAPEDEWHEGVWICPGRTIDFPVEGASQSVSVCSGGERYDELRAGEIREYFDRAVSRGAHEFHKPGPHKTTLVLGRSPLSVQIAGVHFVVLERGSDQWQLRWQAGHESLHRVCTPHNTRHWVHEMVAQVWAMHCIYEEKLYAYAAIAETDQLERAGTVTVDQMRHWRGGEPTGCYGLAYRCGVELIARYGWTAFKQLVTCYDDCGKPDFNGWTRTLPGNGSAARRIVGLAD